MLPGTLRASGMERGLVDAVALGVARGEEHVVAADRELGGVAPVGVPRLGAHREGVRHRPELRGTLPVAAHALTAVSGVSS